MRNTGIIKTIAQADIFLANGQNYVSKFKYPVLLAIFLKVYLPSASNVTLGVIALLAMVVMAILGWFDLRFVHLAQTIAEIMTRKYNPYFSKLEKDLNNRTSRKK